MSSKRCILGTLGLALGSRSSLSHILVFLSLCSFPIPGLYPLANPQNFPLLASPVREDMVVGPECVISLRSTCILREELEESFANSQVKMINDRPSGIRRRVFEGSGSHLH